MVRKPPISDIIANEMPRFLFCLFFLKTFSIGSDLLFAKFLFATDIINKIKQKFFIASRISISMSYSATLSTHISKTSLAVLSDANNMNRTVHRQHVDASMRHATKHHEPQFSNSLHNETGSGLYPHFWEVPVARRNMHLCLAPKLWKWNEFARSRESRWYFSRLALLSAIARLQEARYEQSARR